MMKDKNKNKEHFLFALVGNPNVGKSSIFNHLTGLRQKTGNFPGVTVDKKIGSMPPPSISANFEVEMSLPFRVIDLPGAYSLYPNSQDERVVLNVLSNPNDAHYPDAIVYVADLTALERHLLLFTQIRDLGFPMILAVCMTDVAKQQGILLDKLALTDELQLPIVEINGRTGDGIELLKNEMEKIAELKKSFYCSKPIYQPTSEELKVVERMRLLLPIETNYQGVLWAHHYEKLPFLGNFEKNIVRKIVEEEHMQDLKLQISETLHRFQKMQPMVGVGIKRTLKKTENLTDQLDKILTHPILGKIIFIALMLFVFQSVFSWAEIPKGWIETGFTELTKFLNQSLPKIWLTKLLTDGILAGLSGVLTFVPQIAILFLLTSILEEVGYMARAVFLFDRFMQKFGLNGRSVVALVSSGACAIPAVMSTRTISNWKERLITIMVTPLISCSARIPVYTLLVGFTVPNERFWGIDQRGLAFAGLYVLSVLSALFAGWVFKMIIKNTEPAFLAIELPDYRMPVWKNIVFNVLSKTKAFVMGAGKIIITISIVLWFLAAFGPEEKMNRAEENALKIAKTEQLDSLSTENLIASLRLEESYAGILGKTIEPAIEPLGFDWKIGIALVSSFAAREVFVGTMTTIYSIGQSDDDSTLRERLKNEKRPDGTPRYSFAMVLALLLFYVFAMQCMSTLAVVKRETNGWKWAIIQFVFMFAMAYLSALAAFQGLH
ncbi:MAG: ferrous iron transport protein [Bacteroidota bacterium]|jgi:ferrous iron transport protein B